MHRQALGLSETVLGKEHPDILMSMSNLANILSDQVRYEQVEEIHQVLFSMPLNLLNITRIRGIIVWALIQVDVSRARKCPKAPRLISPSSPDARGPCLGA